MAYHQSKYRPEYRCWTQGHEGQALTAKETTLQLQGSFVSRRFLNPKIDQNGTYPISVLEIKVPSVSEVPVDFQKYFFIGNVSVSP